jgi:hypothetical protein
MRRLLSRSRQTVRPSRLAPYALFEEDGRLERPSSSPYHLDTGETDGRFHAVPRSRHRPEFERVDVVTVRLNVLTEAVT